VFLKLIQIDFKTSISQEQCSQNIEKCNTVDSGDCSLET
jgi:hypothetical protein